MHTFTLVAGRTFCNKYKKPINNASKLTHCIELPLSSQHCHICKQVLFTSCCEYAYPYVLLKN